MKKIPLLAGLLAGIYSAVAPADAPDINKDTILEFIGSASISPSVDMPILGISSIRYDQARQKYIILSDDTGTIPNAYKKFASSRFYELSADDIAKQLTFNVGNDQPTSLPLENVTEKTIKADTQPWSQVRLNGLWQLLHPWTWVHDGHVDTEGVTITDEGELLIASEQGATYPFDSRRASGVLDYYNNLAVPEPTVYSTLLRVDRETGTMSMRHYFPSYYHSSLILPAVDSFSHFLPDFTQPAASVIQSALGYLFDPIQGLQRNKGIESIDRIPGTNRYIAITESALQQDQINWAIAWPEFADHPPSRIIEFTLGSDWNINVVRELLYVPSALPAELTSDPDIQVGGIKTGISDTLALDEHRLLVVERSYIKYKKKANKSNKSVFQIFLVDTRVGKKNEVTRYANISPEDFRNKLAVKKDLSFSSLTASKAQKQWFETLNIEGITLGQKINGEPTIVLINDNDAARTSPTNLLFFKPSR